ncbi:AGCS family alanine or glycine:cation symporter [Geomicrobium halophilum]|uniref:AGCS family alanine or glycine:cation symporter n=1 Tax=Geomicrobium halophilum TaxID=549000 RepID=A0A841PQZ4_9BACL|nr:alanine/glycine:cation symporter family protein [Geomicrobium halophilum]MBB6450234.1 AGCS family alanine or glycine:cation symporter [Geomicrobium halophilum]
MFVNEFVLELPFLESIVEGVNDFIWTYILIGLLIIAGLYFTFRSNFLQIRMFPEMIRVITEKKSDSTGVSAFQAFTISAAARLGTGNITGVALAIAVGGPGAVFWMWVIAAVGMATGFIESTLGQLYKVKDGDRYRGGPAYYIEKALGKRWLSIIYVILIVLTFSMIFNAVQVNTITDSFETAFGMDRLILALILAVLTSFIIFGGVKRLVKVTQFVVPFMAVAYMAVALYVVIINIDAVPTLLAQIVNEAFGVSEMLGGGMGAAIMEGARRGLFSNEAGMGSIPNAAAAANVSHPAKQGLLQSFGVFFDTMIVCTCTALLILLSSDYLLAEEQGAAITQAAMSEHVGGWATAFVAIALLFFAYSSVLGNYYFGETNIEFVRPNSHWLTIYRIAFLILGIAGGVATIELVWTMADLFMALMAILHIFVILILTKTAVTVLKDYTDQRKQGKDPKFNVEKYPEIKNTECWGEGEEDSSPERRK